MGDKKNIRKIIEINEELCNGCGHCISGCAEGALQLVNGKAKMVKDDFCDGFGDCVGTCPTGALKVIEREAPEFDVAAVKEHLKKTQGIEAVHKMEEAHKRHEQNQISHHHHGGGGCPGSRMMSFDKVKKVAPTQNGNMGSVNRSELTQWPVQIHLVSPKAPYFDNRELVIMNTCGGLASADIHWRYLRGRSVVVGCPKLDRTDPYANKIAQILAGNTIPKVIIVRMEVPCCGGLTHIAENARSELLSMMPEKKEIIFEEHTLSLEGDLISIREL